MYMSFRHRHMEKKHLSLVLRQAKVLQLCTLSSTSHPLSSSALQPPHTSDRTTTRLRIKIKLQRTYTQVEVVDTTKAMMSSSLICPPLAWCASDKRLRRLSFGRQALVSSLAAGLLAATFVPSLDHV